MYVDAAYCYRLSSMVCHSVSVGRSVWGGGGRSSCKV